MNPYLVLLLFLALTIGGGSVVGMLAFDGAWYETLRKPSFTPPDWLFPLAWTALYVLIGFAGWRVWRGGELQASRIWWVQLALNFAWMPVFFGLHWIGTALVVIVGLLVAILAFIVETWKADRAAALCFVPYALWVTYAALLNASIAWVN